MEEAQRHRQEYDEMVAEAKKRGTCTVTCTVAGAVAGTVAIAGTATVTVCLLRAV